MRPALMALLPILSCAHVAKVGDGCKLDEAYCDGPGAALACRDSHLTRFLCGGPKGCAVDSARTVSCDESQGAFAATPCLPEYEGRAMCALGGNYLQCLKGEWVQLACQRPGTTCHQDAAGLSCRAN